MKRWFRLPRPSVEPLIDRTCRSCGHKKMHIHEHQPERRIVDWRSDTIHQVRVKCPRCGKTATCRPEGIKPGLHRSGAVVAFGVLLYSLGLSYEMAAAIRSLTGHGSKTGVCRDAVAAGGEAQAMQEARAGRSVRVLGVDGTGQKTQGDSVGVAFAVDAEGQVLLGVERVEEDNPRQVRRFIKKPCSKHQVESILADEHDSYKKVLQSHAVDAEHRLCQTHWKKSKQLRIRTLKSQAAQHGWNPYVRDLDELRRLIQANPPDARVRLEKIHRRYLDYAAAPPGARGRGAADRHRPREVLRGLAHSELPRDGKHPAHLRPEPSSPDGREARAGNLGTSY